MLEAYRYRICPDKSQTVLINKLIGWRGFAYNHALNVKEFSYLPEERDVSCFELTNQWREFKGSSPWLYELDRQALQRPVIHLLNGSSRALRRDDESGTALVKGIRALENDPDRPI